MTGDPSTPSQSPPRGLKTAVIVMGVLLVFGFIALFSAIAYRAVKSGSEVASFGDIAARIGEGERVGAIELDGNRLAVELYGPGSHQIVLFDLAAGREIGRIRLEPE